VGVNIPPDPFGSWQIQLKTTILYFTVHNDTNRGQRREFLAGSFLAYDTIQQREI
jgi:hypothetical protein